MDTFEDNANNLNEERIETSVFPPAPAVPQELVEALETDRQAAEAVSGQLPDGVFSEEPAFTIPAAEPIVIDEVVPGQTIEESEPIASIPVDAEVSAVDQAIVDSKLSGTADELWLAINYIQDDIQRLREDIADFARVIDAMKTGYRSEVSRAEFDELKNRIANFNARSSHKI